jgi:hypothetical protein
MNNLDLDRIYESVIKGLLASCMALRVLDFTEFSTIEDKDVQSAFLDNIKEYVESDVDGAGKLAHVFAWRTYAFGDHGYVINLLEEEEDED